MTCTSLQWFGLGMVALAFGLGVAAVVIASITTRALRAAREDAARAYALYVHEVMGRSDDYGYTWDGNHWKRKFFTQGDRR